MLIIAFAMGVSSVRAQPSGGSESHSFDARRLEHFQGDHAAGVVWSIELTDQVVADLVGTNVVASCVSTLKRDDRPGACQTWLDVRSSLVIYEEGSPRLMLYGAGQEMGIAGGDRRWTVRDDASPDGVPVLAPTVVPWP